MDKKEAAYLLQRIDCNCNDCGFMKRDMDKYNEATQRRRNAQLDSFDSLRERLEKIANEWEEKGDREKASVLHRERRSMMFQYQAPTAEILYGHCQKFDKPVTFIPNTCQLETQKCFVHRKDYTHETTSSVPDKQA